MNNAIITKIENKLSNIDNVLRARLIPHGILNHNTIELQLNVMANDDRELKAMSHKIISDIQKLSGILLQSCCIVSGGDNVHSVLADNVACRIMVELTVLE